VVNVYLFEARRSVPGVTPYNVHRVGAARLTGPSLIRSHARGR
jgi:hypothetical protein